jgi:hypothetical protein
MPAGLQVFGSHGVLQIDETYKNFVMVASGSKASGAWAAAGVSNFVQVVVTNAVTPLVAFSCANQVGLGYVGISGSTWTFTFLTNNPATMNYWVFDESPSASPGSFGFEVYNAAGARVFHSSQKPLRVVGVGAGTYASGRTYAVIRSDAGYSYTSTPTGLPFPQEYQFDGETVAAAISSNVVTAGSVVVDDALVSPDPGSFTPTIGPTLVVDVTHF